MNKHSTQNNQSNPVASAVTTDLSQSHTKQTSQQPSADNPHNHPTAQPNHKPQSKAEDTQATSLALLSTIEKEGLGRIQLFPFGNFQARDGRPKNLPIKATHWSLDKEGAEALIQSANQRKTPYSIDYEHQSHQSHHKGAIPAAGWFKSLEWVEGKGLFAVDVQWTEEARALIKADQYRYISPVFHFNPKTGAITGLVDCALTNHPALDGMMQAEAKAELEAQSTTPSSATDSPNPNPQGGTLMSEDQNTALALLKEQVATHNQTIAKLKETQATDQSTIARLKTENQAKDESIKALNTELSTLKAEQEVQAKAYLVEQGIKEGKLAPALKDWAMGQSKESLEAYLASAPVHEAFKATPKTEANTKLELTEAQKTECAELGISEEAMLATLREERGLQSNHNPATSLTQNEQED